EDKVEWRTRDVDSNDKGSWKGSPLGSLRDTPKYNDKPSVVQNQLVHDSDQALLPENGRVSEAITRRVPRLPGATPLDVRVEKLGQLGFGQCAHLGGFQVTVLEQHQGRNPANVELGRRLVVRVHVHLGNFHLACVFGSELVQYRGDHFAGATPGCPKIYQHGFSGFQYIVFKARIGYVNNGFTHRNSPESINSRSDE